MTIGAPAARRLLAVTCTTALLGSTLSHEGRPGAEPWRGQPEAPIRFADVTAEFGLPVDGVTTWGVAVGPADGRSGPLLLLNRHTREPTLYAGDGATFGEVEVGWAMPMDRHTCSWGEANGDGRSDLFCPQGARTGTGSGANELWLNLPDGFVEAAEAWQVDYATARARTAAWLDYDGDGRLDLLVGAAEREEAPDQLFRNEGSHFRTVDSQVNGLRTTVAIAVGDVTGDGWPDALLLQSGTAPLLYLNHRGTFRPSDLRGIPSHAWRSGAFADFDGDGWLDLHVVSHGRSTVLRNVGGRFEIVDDRPITRGRASAWLDIDNDMRLDLYVVASAQGAAPGGAADGPDFILHQQSDGTFLRVTLPETAGWQGSGDGVAVLDADRDGRDDVFIVNGYARWAGPPVLLRNEVTGGNAAGLEIIGPSANPLGFGARIMVEMAGASYRRPITDNLAGHSQSEVGRATLPLGAHVSANVTIDWPDGSRSCVTVSMGRATQARHGHDHC